ncbi:MAG: hypothetical protein ACTSWL_09020 [Promethearchaeota archaeon]
MIANQIQQMFSQCSDFWSLSDFSSVKSRWDYIDNHPESLKWDQDLISIYYYLFYEKGYIHFEGTHLIATAMHDLSSWALNHGIEIPDHFTNPES